MKRIKKLVALILLPALLLSGCSYRIRRKSEAENTAPEESIAATDTEQAASAPEPGLTKEEAHNRILLSYVDQAQTYPHESGAPLLTFSCRTPQVQLPDLESQAAAINTHLTGLTEEFISGSKSEDDIPLGAEAMLKTARDHYESLGDDTDHWGGYALERSVFVSRGDAAVLSFVYDDYVNRGGAHGDSARTGVNFDVEKGTELRFADLAADEAALRSLCLQSLQEQTASLDESAALFENYQEYLPDLIRDGNWYFSDRGLVIVANTYEIAPYAAGRFDFTITYKSLSGVLHARYLVPVKEGIQGGMDGCMSHEQNLGEAQPLLELTLDQLGSDFLLWANNCVYNVRVNALLYQEYSGNFAADTEYLYLSRMDDGEFIRIHANIPEIIPNLSVSWRLPDGTLQRCLISMSGKDGSLLLTDPYSLDLLPPEQVREGEVLARDLDNDGMAEYVSLAKEGNGCKITVTDGGQDYSQSLELTEDLCLWAGDPDGNGKTELLLSGRRDSSSENHELRCWRYGDGLEPVLFTGMGEDREVMNARLLSVESDSISLEGVIHVLGSYNGRCVLSGGSKGSLTLAENGSWELTDNDSWLQTSDDLNIRLPDGSAGKLSSGTELRLTSIGSGFALFETRQEQRGSLKLSYDGQSGKWLVDGIAEDEAFSSLPYDNENLS